MSSLYELLEKPQADEMYMIAGWRQWADAGAVSSGLPEYLVELSGARLIGSIPPEGYYLFQIPGTHDLMRPIVRFDEGYPAELDTPENRFYYTENSRRGVVIFLGDEPHMDIERYTRAFLSMARELGVRRIVGLGGVYGELPYEKERTVSGSYSLRAMKEEMKGLALSLTEYQGGSSISSYICKRAGEQGIEFAGMYGLVPLYDFSNLAQIGHTVRIENDYVAWLSILRRINYMFKTSFDLGELSTQSKALTYELAKRIDEFDKQAPDAGVKEYFRKLAEDYDEKHFIPLDDVWEENLRKILDKFEDGDEPGEPPEEG